MSGEKVIINLGCGEEVMPNATNIDKHVIKDGVTNIDIITFLKQCDRHSVDEFHMYYVLEHFTLVEIQELTYLLNNALKLNGMVIGIVPDIEQMARTYPGDGTLLERVEWIHKYHYEICSVREETLHAMVFSLEFLDHLFKRDGFVIRSHKKGVGSKDVGLYFEIQKTQNTTWSIYENVWK